METSESRLFERVMLVLVGCAIGGAAAAAIVLVSDPNGRELAAAERRIKELKAAAEDASRERPAVEAIAAEPARPAADVRPSEETQSETPSEFQPDPELQSKRAAFIEELKHKGIIEKIEMPGTIPRVWVGDEFLAGGYDAKAAIANAIYAYYFPDPADTFSGNHIRLIDAHDGNEVGTFDINSGLSLD